MEGTFVEYTVKLLLISVLVSGSINHEMKKLRDKRLGNSFSSFFRAPIKTAMNFSELDSLALQNRSGVMLQISLSKFYHFTRASPKFIKICSLY